MKRSLKILFFAPLGLVLLMWLSFAIKNATKLELTAEVRAELPGQFVSLTDGVIGYDWTGPKNGPVLVLTHGFSMPRFAFDNNVGALSEAGFRVLRYDHYGRGSSDRPDLIYDADLYERELLGLLKALDIKQKIYLLGYSMGGGVATVFASRHPERIQKLVLVAPNGFMPEPSGLAGLATIPGLGDWLMTIVGETRLLSAVQKQADEGIAPENFPEQYREQMRYSDYVRALLSSMRNFIFRNLSAEYAALAESGVPTLLVWGTEDAVVPFAGHETIQRLAPEIVFAPVQDATHAVAYSHPEIVNRAVIDFLR